MAADSVLRDGFDPQRAADIVFGLLSRELYQLLVIEQGWAPEDRERWRPTGRPRNFCPQTEPQPQLAYLAPAGPNAAAGAITGRGADHLLAQPLASAIQR